MLLVFLGLEIEYHKNGDITIVKKDMPRKFLRDLDLKIASQWQHQC